MASLMDQWYLTGRLAEEEKAARLKNQMVLEEMARVKRQEQDMAQFLAARAQQSQPTAQPMGGFGEAAGGLTGLGGTPDTNAQGQAAPEGGMPSVGGTPSAAPPIAQTFGQQAPQAPMPKAVDLMRAQIGAFDTEIAKIRQLATPTAYAAEQKLVKEREGVVEKLRMAEKDEFDQKYKEAQDNWDKWSAVKDQQGLDVLTATAPAEFKQKLALAGLFPNFATGKYDFNDPRMKMFVDNAKGFALTQVQRYEQDKRVADIRNNEENRRLEAERNAETQRANRENEARRREEMRLKQDEFAFRQSKAGGLEGLPKPAPGYRWNEDGTAQELIPGGPAFNKMKGVAMKEAKLLDSAKNDFDATTKVIDQLIGSEDGSVKANSALGSATGLTGVATRRIPGMDARQVQALLATLEAKAAFGGLQKMKTESPTGGALGQVAVKELDLLKNAIAPIDPTVSKEDFVKNLKNMRSAIRASQERLLNTYQEAYAPVLGVKSPAAPKAQAASDEDLIAKYVK